MSAAAGLARLRAASGRALRLGPQLARGGEGRILEVEDAPELVAKLYEAPPEPNRAAKLRAMAALPPARRPAGAAWPVELLLDEKNEVAGFTMPRLRDRHDLFRMSASGDRRRFFPGADYRALVATAANLSRAVASVHAAGHVVGDINERLAMVDARCTVTLIDSDSFQVEANGRTFPCDVGTALFQPPELQEVSTFRGLPRTREHDAFGLAVLVFQLLFLNRHPFAGAYNGPGEAPDPPEAIRRMAFAWSDDPAARGGLSLPPNAMSLSAAGPVLADLFGRAFGARGRSEGRPGARQWATALDAHLGALRPCATEPKHWHLGGECQLCAVERMLSTGVFGPSRAVPGDALRAEAETLWASIAALPPLPPRPPAPSPADPIFRAAGQPYPPLPGGGVGRLLEGLGLRSTATHAAEAQRRREILAAARARHDALRADWVGAERDAEREWRALMPGLRAARDALRRPEHSAAARGREARKLLAAHPVGESGSPGSAPRLRAALLARKISTAADLSEDVLARIPGISYGEVADLLAWRDGLLRQKLALPEESEADARARGDASLAALRDGLMRLRALHERELRERAAAMAALAEAARDLARAEADAAVPLPD